MTRRDELPALREGFALTHVVVVADQDRSREWYAQVFRARDPVMRRVSGPAARPRRLRRATTRCA